MQCPRCAFDNPAGTKFCGRCGTKLGAPCPSCGTLNPEGFAFCGTCGTSLAAAPPSSAQPTEERKVVTILFADVTGSTPMAERLDPEQMRAIMARFFQTMAEVIGRFEGTVEKFIGDEVMAVFGLPAAHEDDPERAVRAALAMRERLEDLNREPQASRGVMLQMRVGINTGEVVANPQATEKGEFMVTGDAVNVAARLRGAAEPGMAIVGERTYWNTVRLAEYVPLSPLVLKGKSLPVAAWQLMRMLPDIARRGPAGLHAPMIGREEEFSLVQGLLQRVIRERRPYLITIAGAPGVGKTRLLEEVQASLPPSVTVRQGRSLPYGSTSLWAIGEIIRADCGILRSDPPAAVTQKLEQRIADLLGEGTGEARQITTQLARILAVRRLETDAGEEGSREDLFWALRRHFERLAGQAPLILAFEDLHWGDTELLDLIEYLAQWAAAGAPLLIVCLTRPELLEVRPNWGGGKRNYTSLFLEPLTAEDTERLLRELLRADTLPGAVASAVGVAEGNPYFVEEILRMLIDTGALQRLDGQWEVAGTLNLTVPDTIQGVVTARLDRLGREEKSILQEASILGTRFWMSGLAHVTGTSEPALASVLTALQAKDFLVERERSQLEGQREFTFKNLIIRDVAYAMLPKSKRSEKHRAYGIWAEQTYGERAEEFADLLAFHWGQAAGLAREIGLPEQLKEVAPKAMQYGLMAGRKAARVYANDQAITHFLTARALAEELGADAERIAAIEGLADVHALQAQWEEASRLYQEALTYHQQKGDAVRQARMQSRIGSTFSGVFDFRQALPHIQSAIETLEAQKEEHELAGIYNQMARAQAYLGNFQEAERFAREGLRLAEQSKMPTQVAEARLFLGWIDVMLGRPEAVTNYPKYVEEVERLNDPARTVVAYHGKAVLYRQRGEYAQARKAAEEALVLARETNNRPRVAHSHYLLANVHFLAGDWAAATGSVQKYLEVAEDVPTWIEHAKSLLAFMEGGMMSAQVSAAKAVTNAEQRREVTSLGWAVDWCAFLYLRSNRLEDARRLLAERLAQLVPMKIIWPAYLYPLAAEAALALGDTAGAAEHCRQAEALAWMDIKPAQGRLLKARGLVHAAQRSWGEAISLIQEAVDLYRKMGQPYDLALCLEALADVYVRRGGEGDEAAAKEALQEAVGIYQRLGADFEVRRIEQASGSGQGPGTGRASS